MRSAIRSDFERLARRRGTQELMHVTRPAPEESEEPAEPPAEEHSSLDRRSWLARLLSR